jgi:hypothetical protein
MKVRRASSLVALVIVLHVFPVAAEDYPAKQVRLIVNTVAGGLMDVAARVTADHLGKALGSASSSKTGRVRKHWHRCGRESGADGYTLGQIQLAMLRSIRTSIRICPLIPS